MAQALKSRVALRSQCWFDTRDSSVKIDNFAMSVLLGEEDTFVVSNCTGKP